MKLETLSPQIRAQQELNLKFMERLEHIMYTEWDPIGVALLIDFDCTGEYFSYVPKMVDMVLQGATWSAISDELMRLETVVIGCRDSRRRCDVTAVLLSHYGPHAATNSFLALVNTDTPESAYQSVLDLVTQTRIDAYEGRWRDVLSGYEKVIALCVDYLPENHELLGNCLNNLAIAYSKTGNLDKAQEMYDRALPELQPGAQTNYRHLMTCLNNMINLLNHRRMFAATRPYFELMLNMNISVDGWQDGRTWETKARLDKSHNTRRPAPKLKSLRLSVENDGQNRIEQFVCLD